MVRAPFGMLEQGFPCAANDGGTREVIRVRFDTRLEALAEELLEP